VRLLLDTHAFLWWVAGSSKLSHQARAAIGNEGADAFVSAASAWEITTKHRAGKLNAFAAVAMDVQKAIEERGFQPLAISIAHSQHAGAMAGADRDPFDRVLAAQALLEGLTLVSNDPAFAAFGVRCLW